MLDLDSADWATLQHAYGAASDIPALLAQLEASPGPSASGDEEPWFSLWSALCPQGEAYEASYAVVPHVVRIAMAAEGPIDPGFPLFVAAVEVARSRERGAALPDALRDDYVAALNAVPDLIGRHIADAWDQTMAQCIAAALAACKGQTELAAALINLDADAIERIASDDF